MTGPIEAKLRQVDSLQPGTLAAAAEGWTKGADGLRHVASQLKSAKNELLVAWEGQPADAASTAFDVLAKTVSERADQMDQAALAVETAKAALKDAKHAPISDLPSLKSGADGEITPQEREEHAQANVDAREAEAAKILKTLDGQLAEARDLLGKAAPYDPTSKVDETDRGTSPGSGPTTTGSHVNSGSASGSAAVIGGNVGGTSATADGALIGTVGAGAAGLGLVAGSKNPGGTTSGGSQIGGVAGSAGVLGGALGGLRNVLGGKTAVAGATPAPASTIGGGAARAGSPVLGGQNGQPGAGARTAGSPGSSSTGRGTGSTGARGASGTTGGRSTGSGAGGRGGRGAAGAAGQRDNKDDQSLDHIRFEDDWIEDEDIAPGVIE